MSKLPNRKVSERKKRRLFIIRHDKVFKAIWDWLVLLLVLFTAVEIPYHASFKSLNDGNVIEELRHGQIDAILIVSILVDCIFILDILVNFLTTYVRSSSDEVIDSPRLIAVHYIKTWFLIDLLAGFPFDWFFYSNQGSAAPALFGLLKSVRLLRLLRVARKLDRYSEYGLAVLFLLMALFTLCAHWFACAWNAISIYEKDNPQSWAVLLQVQKEKLSRPNETYVKLSTGERYTSALYFVMTSMTSVGFGNISANTVAEKIFGILLLVVGALMYACIFGSMVTIIQRFYSKTSSFHDYMSTIREFLQSYKLPEDLCKSVNNYVRHEWSATLGINVGSVLQHFPECIQADITYELYRHVFSGVKIFDRATVSCMHALALKFRTINLQANSYFLKQGDEIDCLYISEKGNLEILVDGAVVDILAEYSVFGYDFKSCPKYPKSSANVRASNAVKIHFIRKDDLMKTLKCYPIFAVSFSKNFQPTYDLCDEDEEGYFQNESFMYNLCLESVAKNTLATSIFGNGPRKLELDPAKFIFANGNHNSKASVSQKAFPKETGLQNFYYLRDEDVPESAGGSEKTLPKVMTTFNSVADSPLQIGINSFGSERSGPCLGEMKETWTQDKLQTEAFTSTQDKCIETGPASRYPTTDDLEDRRVACSDERGVSSTERGLQETAHPTTSAQSDTRSNNVELRAYIIDLENTILQLNNLENSVREIRIDLRGKLDQVLNLIGDESEVRASFNFEILGVDESYEADAV